MKLWKHSGELVRDIVILILLGYIVYFLAQAEWTREQKRTESINKLAEIIRITMREEFYAQEQKGNVFYNDQRYAVRQKD